MVRCHDVLCVVGGILELPVQNNRKWNSSSCIEQKINQMITTCETYVLE